MSFQERLLTALQSINVERHGAGAWLAKKTGTTVKAANKWLNGESEPRKEKVEIISSITGVRSEWLIFGEGEIKRNSSTLNNSLGHVDVYESDEPINANEVEVPFFTEIELAAGNGFSNVSEITTQQIRFNLSTLSNANVSPSKAACCKVTGDSMQPVLPDGSTVGIDSSDISIKDGKMYAINHGGMLRVKYLYRTPFNGLRIRSANSDYQDEEISSETAKDIRIIGRVFWYSVLL